MWLSIMKSLQAYLINADIVADVRLGGYNLNDIRPERNGKGLIYILRENERPVDPNNLICDTEVNLAIHCWLMRDFNTSNASSNASFNARDLLNQNILTRYDALESLEKSVLQALMAYRDEVHNITDDIQLIDLTVTEIAGDGDSNPPLIGCGISVRIIAYERS